VKIEILYFAVVRELVGMDGESVDLPPEITTIRAFRTFIEATHPQLTGRLASVRIAKNEEFATDTDILQAGDTLALIPPVAGG
jgi:molybdopterin synthase sulfur carrier subunit